MKKREITRRPSGQRVTAAPSGSASRVPAGTTLRAYLLRLAWADDDWTDPEPTHA